MAVTHFIDLLIGDPAREIEVEYDWNDGNVIVVSAKRYPNFGNKNAHPHPVILDDNDKQSAAEIIVESGGPDYGK